MLTDKNRSKTTGAVGYYMVHDVFLVLRTPDLDTVLQVGSHEGRVERENPLPRPAGHTSLDAAQDVVGLLGYECMLLAYVQVSLDGIPSFCCVSCTTQLRVICKLAEGALDLTLCVIDEDIEEPWSQDRALRDTTCHQPPPGHGAIDHNSLAAYIQPIPCPPSSSPFKFLSLQLRDKDVV
ncbi:hypothetical protein DUI87_02605 [Hirundo rustica rustica]|uniref:Uncharacterized protein n=1 Tax=Hirundo rustica rustica TaxID=333673 RepID=A0A3M0L9Q0_HIRRU|nr:hypothetical protein DUI87_02605 [Hirundo rustica rustica]